MGELPKLSAMADLQPSMVSNRHFFSWNKYRRKSAMAFRGGAPKSTWLLSTTGWGASIHAATAAENPCSLIAVALGARHVGSGLTDSCAGSG